jgi:hypothetical protein
MTKPHILPLLILALGTCKSSSVGHGGDGGADGAKMDVENDGALGVARDTDAAPEDTGFAPGCGTVGSLCATEDEGCSSGDAIEIACRTIRVCRGGHWQNVFSFLAPCQSGGPTSCPMGEPVAGSACPIHSQLCTYASGVSCGCVTGCESGVDAGPCNKPLAWDCSRANGAPSSRCPPIPPRLEDPCGGQPIQCTYGPYCSAYVVDCKDFRWRLWSLSTIGGCA